MANLQLKTEIELYVINRVREMRLKSNVSQAELALRLNITVGFIGHIESPKHRAKYNLNHINKLAKIFDCSFQEFFPNAPL
jgi:transcriptional regulator with XRE-family HTH domain